MKVGAFQNQNYFNVLSGCPPDVLHDLFEGIVPQELALCLKAFQVYQA